MASSIGRLLLILVLPIFSALMPQNAGAEADTSKIGLVLLHGKGVNRRNTFPTWPAPSTAGISGCKSGDAVVRTA